MTTASLDAAALAAAPLVFSYPLTPTVSINTTVTGDARAVAAISIVDGSLVMWTTTLIQAAPTATLPYDLKLGVDTMKAGAGFTLTIPTAAQMGSVVVSCTIVSPTNPNGTPFQASIANWPLVSSV